MDEFLMSMANSWLSLLDDKSKVNNLEIFLLLKPTLWRDSMTRNSVRRLSNRVRTSMVSRSKYRPLMNRAVSEGWMLRVERKRSWLAFISSSSCFFTWVLIRDFVWNECLWVIWSSVVVEEVFEDFHLHGEVLGNVGKNLKSFICGGVHNPDRCLLAQSLELPHLQRTDFTARFQKMVLEFV